MKSEKVLQQLGAPLGTLMKEIKPQYGLLEYPRYSWQTFKKWYVDDFRTNSLALGPCIFNQVLIYILQGIQLLQVNDTCGGSRKTCKANESKAAARFISKPLPET